jgi:hypothetical protein
MNGERDGREMNGERDEKDEREMNREKCLCGTDIEFGTLCKSVYDSMIERFVQRKPNYSLPPDELFNLYFGEMYPRCSCWFECHGLVYSILKPQVFAALGIYKCQENEVGLAYEDSAHNAVPHLFQGIMSEVVIKQTPNGLSIRTPGVQQPRVSFVKPVYKKPEKNEERS